MINVRDVTISDLLPYTMKTPKNIALSKAFGEMTRYLYDTLQSVVFWADIKTASDMLLIQWRRKLIVRFMKTV